MLLCNKDLGMAISLVLLMLVTVNLVFLATAVPNSSHRWLRVLEKDGLKANNDPKKCKTCYADVFQTFGGTQPHGLQMNVVHIVVGSKLIPGGNCKIAQLHLSCGSFKSDEPIPPNIFRRVGDNDCLVNNGQPILSDQRLMFEYISTQQFPLDVSSFQCLD